MKNLFLIFGLCSLLFTLQSCKPKQQLTRSDNSASTEVIILHDKLTPVALPVDSSHITALFECDSNFNVVLKELNEIKSNNIQSAFDWHDGFFDLKLKSGGDTVYIASTDFYWKINTKQTITKTITVEKKLSYWQSLCIALGKLFLMLLLIALILFIVKYIIKLKLY